MSYRIGIVGATGAVGQELIHLLLERQFPLDSLRLFASRRSAGKSISMHEKTFFIEETQPGIFEELDLVFLAASASLSKELAPIAIQAGCVVIDNSSAYRQDLDVPLVIPEINAGAGHRHQGLLANPNCSIAVTLMGLYPLHRLFEVERVICSTYQAVSGAGVEAIDELEEQLHAWADSVDPDSPRVFPHHSIAFNVIPHVDKFGEDGYTGEERKMLNEARKILDLPDLRLSATCVRVPVIRAHSISVSASFKKPVDLKMAREGISYFEGAELCDEPEAYRYPTPLQYSEKIQCGVGRLRMDHALDNGLSFFVSGDQLWKGAALNAVQIAESLDMASCLQIPVSAKPTKKSPAKKKVPKKAAKKKATKKSAVKTAAKKKKAAKKRN